MAIYKLSRVITQQKNKIVYKIFSHTIIIIKYRENKSIQTMEFMFLANAISQWVRQKPWCPFFSVWRLNF